MPAQVSLAPVRPTAGAPGLPEIPRTVADVLAAVTDWPVDLVPGRAARRSSGSLLSALGATDLGVARAVEPHLDALAILDQAGSGTLPDS